MASHEIANWRTRRAFRVRGRGLGNPRVRAVGRARAPLPQTHGRAKKFLTERPARTARRACAPGNAEQPASPPEFTGYGVGCSNGEELFGLSLNHCGTRPLPQSSSASRFTAGAFEFFILSQSGERPERLTTCAWEARRDEPGREGTLRHSGDS